MIELITHDRPDVVCLQELPVWALPRLERWSGMWATSAVARRPLLPAGAEAVGTLHAGLRRHRLTGEADAILTSRPARRLGTHVVGDAGLRRIAHCIDLDGMRVVNFHIDGDRLQFDRTVALAGDCCILAGDSNLRAAAAAGFSPPLADSVDQILVRGLALQQPPFAWPLGQRTFRGRVLSDHAPVEATIA
jgi:endonuclease/exonuclease/phosphatase family metal-dependent hydrolase